MKKILLVIFSFGVVVFGFSFGSGVLHVTPVDTLSIGLFIMVAWMGESGAHFGALVLGSAADMMSALPFGTFIALFLLLGYIWQGLASSLFTNRSWWADSARAAAGTLIIHFTSWLVALLMFIFSREIGIAPVGLGRLAADALRAMIFVGIFSATAALLIRKIKTVYGQKFLSRGGGPS